LHPVSSPCLQPVSLPCMYLVSLPCFAVLQCWMLDVGCWMLDVGCWMLDVTSSFAARVTACCHYFIHTRHSNAELIQLVQHHDALCVGRGAQAL
jgi:hypothetical protein